MNRSLCTPGGVGGTVPATLSAADPSSDHTGHLVNGAFFLPSPLQAAANTGAYAALPTSLLIYSGPICNDVVSLRFKRSIGAGDALRTATYAKTLTFTLSTTTP